MNKKKEDGYKDMGNDGEKIYFVENKSKMIRCASGDTPKTAIKMQATNYDIVRIEIGYNAFTQKEMDIIKKCKYTKNMFGPSLWFNEFEMPENVSDTDIEHFFSNTKQVAMMIVLKSLAKSKQLKDEIEEKLPASHKKDSYKMRRRDISLSL